jgi:hypothetical protein
LAIIQSAACPSQALPVARRTARHSWSSGSQAALSRDQPATEEVHHDVSREITAAGYEVGEARPDGSLGAVTTDKPPTARRRATRVAVVLTGLGLGMLATPALALPPETWPDTSEDSGLLQFLLVVAAALAIIAVVSLLVLLPSMIRRQEAEQEGAFSEEPEWFGGPRAGLAAIGEPQALPPAEPAAAASSRGGAGARW